MEQCIGKESDLFGSMHGYVEKTTWAKIYLISHMFIVSSTDDMVIFTQ